MVRQGRPLSLDRSYFYWQMTGVGAILLLLLVLLLVTVTAPPKPEDTANGATVWDSAPSVEYNPFSKERERADAYSALRDYLDNALREDDVRNVYCRENRHRLVGRYYEFFGKVEVEKDDGELYPHQYIATLEGNLKEGWRILSVTLKPIETPYRFP